MSISVGIGGSSHDFSTCVISDNACVVAIEDERINRVRYALGEPAPCEKSFKYLLDWLQIKADSIDRIVGNELLEPSDRRARPVSTLGARTVARINRDKFPPLILLNHHLMHAYSTFFTGPFEEAAILVMDGSGSPTGRSSERETMTFSIGRRNTIKVIASVVGESSGQGFSTDFPPLFHNSLGHLYRAVTQTIGFGWMHAGKTMGLAPYGDDRYVDVLMRFVTLLPQGQYQIRIGGRDGLLTKLLELRQQASGVDNPFAIDAALAHSVQTIVENIVFHALDYLWNVTRTPNLCLAGGVALNGLLNGKIHRRTNFKNIHVVCAPGDGGTAIGSAIWDYVTRISPSAPAVRFKSGPFWGRTYGDDEIKTALDKACLASRRPPSRFHSAAKLIAEGKTVAWYEGAAEFGPRALGHRSIFADPRRANLVDHINRNIKGREWFRPIAPAVTETASSVYFEPQCYSPYMQFVWPVREQYRAALPAITHVDGCSRIQTVRRDGNESLHRLLEEFENITGFPVLINTSFNVEGFPMVETPTDAVETFRKSALDALVIGDYIIEKS